MSERYITDRFLPDKAIDLIDEACSRLNLDSPQLSKIPELQTELERLQAQLDDLTQSSARSEDEENLRENRVLPLAYSSGGGGAARAAVQAGPAGR